LSPRERRRYNENTSVEAMKRSLTALTAHTVLKSRPQLLRKSPRDSWMPNLSLTTLGGMMRNSDRAQQMHGMMRLLERV
jgi:hypothetical protein